MRILQVLPALEGGGVERATLDMVQALRAQFPATYVTSQGGMLEPELVAKGGTHFKLPLASKNPIQMFLNAFRLARLIRAYDIHLLHARSRAPAWSALWAARWTGTPLVTTYHGAYPASNLFKKFYNSVMVRGNCVIAISDFVASYIKSHYPLSAQNIRLIREGIDVDAFNPHTIPAGETASLRKQWEIPENATIILLSGRITRLKGHEVFIEAIRRLNHLNVAGLILGQPKPGSVYFQELTQKSRGLPIRCVPPLDDIRVAYALADVVVCPSLVPETFGRVAAEAGTMERPVIATHLGALREVCQHEKTGFLIPPHDAGALAQTIEKVITMPASQRAVIGKAARAHIISHFSLKQMCAQTIDLYKGLAL